MSGGSLRDSSRPHSNIGSEKSGFDESGGDATTQSRIDSIPRGADALTGRAFESWSRIPAELRERRQWCIAGPDKRPLSAGGGGASVTDPSTWTDFETASRIAALKGLGIGYVQSADDPFSCIDLDVKDDTPREWLDRYQSIIEQFDSFTEHSQSGRGFHVWVKGKIGSGKRRDGVEVYSQARFMICTGNVVWDRPIADRRALLTNLVSEIASGTPTEIELWGGDHSDWSAATRAAEDAGELGRLFRGDWEGRYPSQSEADLALVKLLMPLTDSPRECWLTFRLSKLGEREKAKRADYAKSTMAKAIQHVANDAMHLETGRRIAAGLMRDRTPPVNERHFRLLLDNDLDLQPPLRWLVKRIIPNAGIGAIFGDSGTFKSFLALGLLANISNGQQWFGNRVKPAPAVYVPFEGQGGIPNRIKAWRLAEATRRNPQLLLSVVPPDDVRSNIAFIMDPINLREQADRDKLVATLIESGWSGGVLCIDTLAHASAGIDENSSAMAEMISIFRDLQLRLGGVILLIHHSGKDSSRGMRGWSGLHAAMDFVIECQREKDNPALMAEFVVTKLKDGSSGTSAQFRLHAVQLGIDEDGDYISSLVVVPASDEAVSDNPFKTDGDDAAIATEDDSFVDAWIREEVAAGKRPTGRWLDAQRVHVMDRRNLTQKRLRDAVARLKGIGRLQDTEGGPSGAKWLRPVDFPAQGAT